MTDENLQIKTAKDDDLQSLVGIAPENGADYFVRCLQEQAAGHRLILLAWLGQSLTGYVFLNRQPRYQPFRRLGIPEIQDLFVIPGCRRQGIGAALVAACEQRARQEGAEQMGIAVGLHAGFGAAQRLYVRMGYVPDGGGVTYDREAVRSGDMRPVDDDLTLMLIKDLV